MSIKKEVKIKLELRRDDAGSWEIFLLNRQQVKVECQKMFGKPDDTIVKMKATVTAESNRKTQGQMGYFYVEVRPKISLALIDLGYYDMDEDGAEIYLRNKFLGKQEYFNHLNGEVISEIVHLSDLDQQQMRDFINKCVNHGNIDLLAGIRSADEHRSEQENFNP